MKTLSTTQPMDKIIHVALNNKFPGIDLDTLIRVINATPDRVVATEMLLGIYEYPMLYLHAEGLRTNQVGQAELLSTDLFKKEVTYSYSFKDIRTRFFKTQEEADQATKDTWQNCESYKSEKYPFQRTWDNGIASSTSECSIEKWIEHEVKESKLSDKQSAIIKEVFQGV